MSAPTVWKIRGRELSLERPLVMGIVNVTPDSFSDGGRYLSTGAALAHAARLLAEGADILDVGGESTRPQGATPVSARDELRRILPVIKALAAERPNVVLSVDTVKASVAEAALSAGAHIVNDVSGLRLDDAMAPLCATEGAGVVVMHSRGTVGDMSTFEHATYAGDFLDDMHEELSRSVDVARRAGVARESIAVDPGIGFAKRTEHSLRALGCLERLAAWGYPVVVGPSRKRFIGELTGGRDVAHREFGSIGASVVAFERGAHILRVHDVAGTRQALDVAAAIRVAGQES